MLIVNAAVNIEQVEHMLKLITHLCKSFEKKWSAILHKEPIGLWLLIAH